MYYPQGLRMRYSVELYFYFDSTEVYRLFSSYLQVLVKIQNSTMADGINFTGDLPRYVSDCLLDHLTENRN